MTDWPDPYAASRWRSLILKLGIAFLVVAAVVGFLVWIAAGHYARGVAALDEHAYGQAAWELSAAKILVFPYRDAQRLEDQARKGLLAEAAALEREQARSALVSDWLERAGVRLDAGDASGVLEAVRPILEQDLQTKTYGGDAVRESAAALADDLAIAASAALRRAEWRRAEQYAAALLILEPSGGSAAALAARAQAGKRLSVRLARAEDAARRGQWRLALRLALAVVAERKSFPGAAGLVAEARAALTPKAKPAPTQAATAAAATAPAGGTTPASTPAPPPP